MGGWWREGKCHITGYINSITQLAEAQGNDESDRGERTPGNGGGGGITIPLPYHTAEANKF